MFHIVFNVNDNYVKYLSMLCYSIIENAALNAHDFSTTHNFSPAGGGGVKPL